MMVLQLFIGCLIAADSVLDNISGSNTPCLPTGHCRQEHHSLRQLQLQLQLQPPTAGELFVSEHTIARACPSGEASRPFDSNYRGTVQHSSIWKSKGRNMAAEQPRPGHHVNLAEEGDMLREKYASFSLHKQKHTSARQLTNVTGAAAVAAAGGQDQRQNVVLAAGFGMRFRQVCPFLRSWAMFSPGTLVGGVTCCPGSGHQGGFQLAIPLISITAYHSAGGAVHRQA
jgi:hypothetical protein